MYIFYINYCVILLHILTDSIFYLYKCQVTSCIAGDDMLVCSFNFHRQRPVRLFQHSSLRPVQLHSILSPVLHHQHSTILLFISQMMRYTCRVYIIFYVILFLFHFMYIYDIVTFMYFLQTDPGEYAPDADPQQYEMYGRCVRVRKLLWSAIS